MAMAIRENLITAQAVPTGEGGGMPAEYQQPDGVFAGIEDRGGGGEEGDDRSRGGQALQAAFVRERTGGKAGEREESSVADHEGEVDPQLHTGKTQTVRSPFRGDLGDPCRAPRKLQVDD
jgi:hypothetical protein